MRAALRAAEAAAGREEAAGSHGWGGGWSRLTKGGPRSGGALVRKVWAVRREGGMEGGRRGLRAARGRSVTEGRRSCAARGSGREESPARGARSRWHRCSRWGNLGPVSAGRLVPCVCACLCVGGVVSVVVCPPSAPRSARRCPSALLSARC